MRVKLLTELFSYQSGDFLLYRGTEPKLVSLAVQKTSNVKIIMWLNWIRDDDTPGTQRFFGIRGMSGRDRDARVQHIRRRGIPVGLEHQDCLPKVISNLLFA